MKGLPAHCTYFALLFVTICGGTVHASVSTNDQSKLISLTAEGRRAYSERKFDLAEQKYAEAVKLAGSSFPAKARIALLSNLGAAYREDHKYAEAEDAFKKALVIGDAAHLNYDPSTKLAMQQYAMLLRKLKRPQEADALEIRAAAGLVAATTPEADAKTNPARSGSTIDINASVAKDSKAIKLAVDVQEDFEKVSLDELKSRKDRDPQNWRFIAQVGAKYQKLERHAEAAEEFKQALRNADDATAEQKSRLRYFMAENYYRADRPAEALEAYRQLCSDNPNDPRFLLKMGVCYDALGDMTSELATWELFLQRWPQDANAPAISQNVERLRRDVARAGQTAQGENQPTASELKKSFLTAKMPLRVFIDQKDEDRINFKDGANDAQVTENTPGGIIQRAMQLWTQASQGRITFELVDALEKADITCAFTEEPDGLEVDSAAGVTSHRKRGDAHVADILLLTVVPQSTETTSRAAFAAAALHEFGHALGLEHSNTANDVMYRAIHTKPLVNLSNNDCDRICKLYTYRP